MTQKLCSLQDALEEDVELEGLVAVRSILVYLGENCKQGDARLPACALCVVTSSARLLDALGALSLGTSRADSFTSLQITSTCVCVLVGQPEIWEGLDGCISTMSLHRSRLPPPAPLRRHTATAEGTHISSWPPRKWTAFQAALSCAKTSP